MTDTCFIYKYPMLDRHLVAWRERDNPPDGVGVLSGGEYRALALAAGHESLLKSPLESFLLLDEHLQRWVLERRGILHLYPRHLGT